MSKLVATINRAETSWDNRVSILVCVRHQDEQEASIKYSLKDTPANSRLAERLKTGFDSGIAYNKLQNLKRDDGSTYWIWRDKFTIRTLNADLKKLGI